ncbi:hypothetical protein E4U42_007570 [Claviceps africana]|uniref:Uncharacterized protein n=1 Tax=Claviceps africana TaxID=83212 RepID=A0A8K0J1Q9_9HYPO|nr:hypothetical protein E4U42_007570 [Claviceps africana]
MPGNDTKSTDKDNKSSNESEKNGTGSSPDCSDVEIGTAKVVDLRASTTRAEAKQLSTSGFVAQGARSQDK